MANQWPLLVDLGGWRSQQYYSYGSLGVSFRWKFRTQLSLTWQLRGSFVWNYSRTSLMQTPKGRKKVSTLGGTKNIVVSCNRTDSWNTQQALRKVSTRVGCLHRWDVHRARFHCTSNIQSKTGVVTRVGRPIFTNRSGLNGGRPIF